jgi:hypothetical protein
MNLTPMRGGILTAFVSFTFYATVENIQPHGWVDWYKISQEGQKYKPKL